MEWGSFDAMEDAGGVDGDDGDEGGTLIEVGKVG
jgi:hypothetical protein